MLTNARTNFLSRLLPRVRNRHLFIADLVLLLVVARLSFAVRLETLDPGPYPFVVWLYVVAAPLINIPLFRALGIYRRFWRYASADDAMIMVVGVLLGGVIEEIIFLVILAPLDLIPWMPRSIPLIDTMLTLASVGGLRFMLRVGLQRLDRWTKAGNSMLRPRRVLVAGAGEAGAMAVRELEANPQTGMAPIGFVDDDPQKAGMHVHGYRVLGARHDIAVLVKKHHIDEVIIAMPAAPGRTVREIMDICGEAGVGARIVPGIYDVLSGRVRLQQIRHIQIEDLLRREPVQTDGADVSALVAGRRVLVTGAGGSIGSELCRQIALCNPSELVLVGHGENSIFAIHNEMLRLQAAGRLNARLWPVIADLRDGERLTAVLDRFRPEIVFHAAAHKHVPLMESNPEDAVSNNVLGTRLLVNACIAAGVSHFVLISSDKAVNPTSVMGTTKRVAELIVQQAALRYGRCYVSVRFGNVLGSRGSVVPFFQQQISEGGPVTVTHPDVKRYFMTIPEAVQLVLQAATLGTGGEVFVLDMGQPIRIVDLARDLIRLSGLEPGQDIDIIYTGLRPGEKLFEEMFADVEAYVRTRHEKIFVCRATASFSPDPQTLDVIVDDLLHAARGGDTGRMRVLLQELVPEYTPVGAGALPMSPGFPMKASTPKEI